MKTLGIVALGVIALPIMTASTMLVMQLAGGTDDDFVRAFYYSSGVLTGYAMRWLLP